MVRGDLLNLRTGLIKFLFSCELKESALFLAHQMFSIFIAIL